jgi:hypothetical protein
VNHHIVIESYSDADRVGFSGYRRDKDGIYRMAGVEFTDAEPDAPERAVAWAAMKNRAATRAAWAAMSRVAAEDFGALK